MNKEKALQLAVDCYHHTVGSERWKDVKERSLRGGDYYAGVQTYTSEQIAEAQKAGKPLRTYNEILPIINYITSIERDNRKDMKVVHVRNGFEEAAAAMSEIIRHVVDHCEGEYVISDIFLNGIRNVFGYFKIEVSYQEDPVNGQFIIRSLPPLSVKNDPSCLNYDPNARNGSSYMIFQEYRDRSELKLLYPDYAKDINEVVDEGISRRSRGRIGRLVDRLLGQDIEEDTNDDDILFDRDKFNKFKLKFTETYLKEYVPRTLLIDKKTTAHWFFDPKDKMDGLRLEQAKQQFQQSGEPGRMIIKEKWPMPLMNRTMHLGEDLCVEHKEDPYSGMALYPIIPFSPFGDVQYDMGFIDNLVGPQDGQNKRMTNAEHILNATANGGYLVASADNTTAMNDLMQYGSSPNYVINLSDFGGVVEAIEPKKISTGHIQLLGIERNYMEEISGVTGASRGYDPTRQESGRLYQQKIKQSISTNQIVFDRFDHTTQIAANVILGLVRHTDVYTEEEIGNIVDTNNVINDELRFKHMQEIVATNPAPKPPDPTQLVVLAPAIQTKFTEEYAKDLKEYEEWLNEQTDISIKAAIYKQIKNFQLYKYGAKVLQSPHAETTRIASFFQLEALLDKFPIEVIGKPLLRSLDLPKSSRDEMIKTFDTMTQGAT